MNNFIKKQGRHTNTFTKIVAWTIVFFFIFYSADLFFDNYDARSPILFQSPIVKRSANRLSIEPLKPTPTKKPTPTSAPKEKSTINSFPKYLTDNGAKNREKALAYLSLYYSGDNLVAADNILKKEAGYRTDAINGNCGGMPQACPASKMGCALDQSGFDCQLQWFVGYVNQRYGTPLQAWKFHEVNNYY